MAANLNDSTAAAFVYSYLQEKDPKYAETFKKKTNAVSLHFQFVLISSITVFG